MCCNGGGGGFVNTAAWGAGVSACQPHGAEDHPERTLGSRRGKIPESAHRFKGGPKGYEPLHRRTSR